MQKHEGPDGDRRAAKEQQILTGRLLKIVFFLAATLVAVLAYRYWGQ